MIHPLNARIAKALPLIYEEKEYLRAIAMLIGLRAEAEALGLGTACLEHLISIAADCGEQFELAAESILMALRQEPLNVSYAQSLDIIARRIDQRLTTAEGDDRRTLYMLLVMLERVSVNASLKNADWCIDNGDLETAKLVAFSILVVEPINPSALELRAKITDALASDCWFTEMEEKFGVASTVAPAMAVTLN